MIFWQGFGIMALGIPFFVALITQFAVNFISGKPDFYNQEWWPILFTCVVSAVLVFLFDTAYLEKRPSRQVIDKTTGKEFTLKEKNTFFFIPVKYWAIVWLGLGIYWTVKRFIH